jgi:hypothetical protein
MPYTLLIYKHKKAYKKARFGRDLAGFSESGLG